ncbi:non-LTR retroelement reverse transcriptase-like, related [Artemisia annua]|uniref:Non-LTR retroelement reverse transcriptase-like, related n=1 Tax=Artemisia annua TaxID=35608 RepID=A0A2U1MUW4_ARTAN|nr:non-LTR retroelement reverse transcriptase-like, related [Artemisia annua]
MDSDLKINLHQSKLTGIGVSKEDIELTAAIFGYSTFSPPFNYLEVKVGAAMSRLNSWNEVSDKISARLSKWNVKTLSIGGCLTKEDVELTAAIFGCSTFSPPFNYLEVKVGAAMSRLNSWNEVSDKISARLSK